MARTALNLVLVVMLGVLAPASASALVVECCYDDSILTGLTRLFEAEGRVGDLLGKATFELDLGPSTAAPAVTAQYGWVAGSPEKFTLAYDATANAVTFTLGGVSLAYGIGSEFLGFVPSSLYLRTRAPVNTDPKSYMELGSLVLDGVGIQSLTSGSAIVQVLRITGDELLDGFTLEGTATMYWSTATAPKNSNLAFQIKAADPITPVPEPATLLLLGGGLAGLAGLGRRKPRR